MSDEFDIHEALAAVEEAMVAVKGITGRLKGVHQKLSEAGAVVGPRYGPLRPGGGRDNQFSPLQIAETRHAALVERVTGRVKGILESGPRSESGIQQKLSAPQRELLPAILASLVDSGEIIENSEGRYRFPPRRPVIADRPAHLPDPSDY